MLRRRFRQALEIVLARAAGAAIGPLPRPAVTGLARFLGDCGYALAPGLRRIGMANLELAFGREKTDAEKRRILRQSFRGVALVALDLFWFSRNTRERILSHVAFREEAKTALARTPMICLTGHLGNWEALGCAVTAGGHALASVATPLKNPEVDRMLVAMRGVAGQEVIRRKGAVREMLRALRSGGRVAMLLDQNTKIKEGGVFVDFFGVPATVSPAAAALALRSGSALGFGFCIPEGRGYRVIVPDIVETGPASRADDEAVLELTRRITEVYERVIREHPENWLWMYKRWKHVRPGDEVGRYPFYAIRPAQRRLDRSDPKRSC